MRTVGSAYIKTCVYNMNSAYGTLFYYTPSFQRIEIRCYKINRADGSYRTPDIESTPRSGNIPQPNDNVLG